LLHPGTGHGVRCVSRPPSDGCRSTRGGRQGGPRPEGEGTDPVPRNETTLRRFDPRRQQSRIAADDAFLSFGPPPPHEGQERLRTPGRRWTWRVGDGVPTGPRRTRPHGRSSGCNRRPRQPCGRPTVDTGRGCGDARIPPRGIRAPPHLPIGRSMPRVATGTVPVDFKAFLRRRVRSASSRCRESGARSFHGFWSPSRPRPRSLVSAVSRGSDPACSPTPAEADAKEQVSVRGGCRSRCRLPTSGGF